MLFLRQSTAVDIAFGPLIDDDGITPATGLSITQAETRLKKNNGAWAQANDNTTATHEEEGWYEKELDATDTNTVGHLIVAVYISGNLACWKEFQVVEEAVYDMFFAASATGIIGTAQTGDSFARLGAPAGASVSADVAAVKTQTAAIETDTQDIQARLPAALVSGRIDASVGAMAANVMTAAAAAADLTTELQSGLATAANLATLQTSVDTIDNFLDTEVAAILADTNELQTDWADGGRLDLILDARASQTSVNTIDDFLDTEVAAILAAVDTEVAAIKAVTDLLPNAGALTSLATQASVNTIDDFLDTEIAAIKAKTDSLTFTTAGLVDANVQQINDVTITGDGQVGTEFGV